jgi:hypothetical protein
MNPPEERIARTESLFRDVNERIAESAQRFSLHAVEFVCECADQQCTDRVEATLQEYELARSEGNRFLLLPGHEDERVERVVAQRGSRLAIVEKIGRVVARTARRLDPRAEPA